MAGSRGPRDRRMEATHYTHRSMRSSRHSTRSTTRSTLSLWARTMIGAALLSAVTVVPAVSSFSPATVSADHVSSQMGAGGEYHSLAPARIYDSRPATSVNEPAPAPKSATPTQPTFDIRLRGVGGVPVNDADVLAVVVNITVTEPTAAGWLNAYGAGESGGLASIVNFTAGQTVPNLSIVRPGANGDLTIKLFSTSASGSAHVVVDVFGWFSKTAFHSDTDPGARLVPIAPGRILDTREAGGAFGAGEQRALPIRGATLATGERLDAGADLIGVVLNVTGINQEPASTGTFLSVVPELAPGTAPSTSNVNLSRGQIKPNMVFVPVGADGSVRLFNHAGATHVAVDVVGYLTTKDVGERAGRVVPLAAPYRVFDTRQAQWQSVALGPGQAEDWSFDDFVTSVTVEGSWLGPQDAVIGNLTSAELKRQVATVPVSSFLTVYPTDQTRPVASNLNMVEGAPVPNLAIMKYGPSSTVRVFNLQGFNHYLFDASAVVLGNDP